MKVAKLLKHPAAQMLSLGLLAILVLVAAPDAMAQTTGGFATACKNVTGFFKNFETILKVASVSIVTIAVVFAGYQIAFAHKRLSDVAPILVGGLLIGGAATIAGWFVADWTADGGANADCTVNTGSLYVGDVNAG